MSRLKAPGLSIPSLAGPQGGPHRPHTWSESNLSEAKEELIECLEVGIDRTISELYTICLDNNF